MWSPVVLLCFLRIAFANVEHGWQHGKEYIYNVRSRTLASYNLESNEYTGVIVKAYLIIQPNGQDTLVANISQPRFSQIHTHLENGWDSTIPPNQLNLETYPLSSKAFEIKITNGVVRDLIIEKTVPIWEINIIKSIVSQLQVDTLGENAVKSKYNQLPQANQPYAVFTVVEDSVGGKCEALYDISALPNHVLQSNPELAPMPEILEGGEFISVVKTKNYTNCDQRVGYHHGFSGRNPWEPDSNDDEKFLARSHVSRTIISGNLRKYTIQSSVGTNKIIINPSQKETNRGMVVSKVNLTLDQIKDISEPISVSSDTESARNLMYNYDDLFRSETSRGPSRLNYYNSKSKDKKYSEDSDTTDDSSDSTYDNGDNSYLRSNPKLTEAPQYPMLPYFIGDHGKSFQTNNNIGMVNVVNSIAQQIGNEMELPNSMTKEQTLEKYTILYKLIRTMSAEQIAESQRSLYEPDASSNQLNPDSPNQNTRRNAWVVFRDAVAQAGTGPALANVKQWITNKQVDDYEAAAVVDTLSKFIEISTSEYMDAFFDLIKMPETKTQNALHDSAILSFSNIIRHALLNKKSSHNHFSVNAFGKSLSKNIHNIHKKYIPYLIEELEEVIKKRDNPKIQIYISALGRIADPRILSVFEPYLEGRKKVSPYQRLYMVLSLYTLTSVYPDIARSVLYRIYANTGEHHEIRTAAVYLLMRAKPPLSMLQRMADYTNYDSSKHVNSAVKSMIESLAQLQDSDDSIFNTAKIALPLLTSETYGSQYSRAFLFNYLNPETHSGFFLESYYIGSEDSIIPKVVNIGIYPTFKGFEGPRLFLGGAVSSVQNLWNLMEQKLFNKYENYKNRTEQEKKYTAKNIAKILKIVAQEPEQVEGFLYLDNKKGNNMYTFDNNSIEYLSKQIEQWHDDLSTGKNVKGSKYSNYELTLSFPMESGYPFLLTLEIPQLVSINGNFKSNTAFMKGSSIPQSTSISGKVNFLYGLKTQKRFGFVSSFENQEYIAGIDRMMQFYLPLKSELSYDVNEREAYVKLQPSIDEVNFNMLYYRTQAFTAKHDVLNWQPVTNDKNTHIIYKDRTTSSEFEISGQGNKRKLAFQWEKPTSYASERYEKSNNKYEEAMEAGNKLASSIATLYYPNNIENSEYESYSVNISPDSSMSAELRVSYEYSESRKNNKDHDTFNRSPMMKLPYLVKSLKGSQRRQELLKDVSQNINSAQANAIDIDFRLNGDNQSFITFTAAQGNSNFDEKSRALLYASANVNGSRNYYVSAGFEGKTPNVNTLDYEETLKANNEQEYEIEIHYGDENVESHENISRKIKLHSTVKQSEELKNKIRQSQNALLCSEHKKNYGDKMTSTCQKVNRQAKSVNAGYFTVAFEGEPHLNEVTKSALDYVDNVSSKYTTKQKDRRNKSDKNKMKFDFEISPNNNAINVIVQTDEGKTQYNVPLGNFYNNYYDFDGSSSNIEKSYAKMTQRGNCYLGKTEAETFDNHRYPLQLDKCWYVVMTSYPRNNPDTSRQRLDIPENMNVIIMAKEKENKEKEAQVTLGETEIRFFTSQSSKIHVTVNGAEIEFSKRESYIVSVNGETIAEVIAQPDNTVILISEKYNVRFTYDIYYAEIEAGERYRNSVRGLCGNFDGRSENDQLSPKGCQLKNPTDFAATYALINEEQCEGSARRNAEKAFAAKCYYEYIQPGDVISERDAGRTNQQSDEPNSDENKHCTHHRTKVLRAKDEICFSMRPLPVCSSHCTPAGTIDKRIPFHCVANTNAAEKVADRVENGINPNLGSKLVSRFENYQIPIYCKV